MICNVMKRLTNNAIWKKVSTMCMIMLLNFLLFFSCSNLFHEKNSSVLSLIPVWRINDEDMGCSRAWEANPVPDYPRTFLECEGFHTISLEQMRKEDHRLEASKSFLGKFYTDLYARKTDWKAFTDKYSDAISSYVLEAIKEKYARKHGGREGYDWGAFGGNVEDTSEINKMTITPIQDNWFLVKILAADTTKILISTWNDGSISGIVNSKQHIAMNYIIHDKEEFLRDFYHDLYENHYDHKILYHKYCNIFTLKVAKILRRSYTRKHLKGHGYDWNLFTEGLGTVPNECPKVNFSFEKGEWYGVETSNGVPTGLQIRLEDTSNALWLITGLRKGKVVNKQPKREI